MTTATSRATSCSTNLPRHIGVAAIIALGMLVTACGTERATVDSSPPTTTVGYPYDHDSRINETPTTVDHSSDHDSLIID
jgi:hypothetical protein